MPLLAALAAAAPINAGAFLVNCRHGACSTFYLGFGELILHRQRPVAVQNWFSNWLLQSAELVFFMCMEMRFSVGGALAVRRASRRPQWPCEGGRGQRARAPPATPLAARRARWRGGRGWAGGARRARGDRRDFAKGLFEGTLRRDFSKGLSKGLLKDFNIYTWQ